jgi:hypothetical protein
MIFSNAFTCIGRRGFLFPAVGIFKHHLQKLTTYVTQHHEMSRFAPLLKGRKGQGKSKKLFIFFVYMMYKQCMYFVEIDQLR